MPGSIRAILVATLPFAFAATALAQPAPPVYEWSWDLADTRVQVEAQVFADAVVAAPPCYMCPGSWPPDGADCWVLFPDPPPWLDVFDSPAPSPGSPPAIPPSLWDYADDNGNVLYPPCDLVQCADWNVFYVGPFIPSPSAAAAGATPGGGLHGSQPFSICDLDYSKKMSLLAPLWIVSHDMYGHEGLIPEFQVLNDAGAFDDDGVPGLGWAEGLTEQVVTLRSRLANPDFIGMAPGSVPSSRTWEFRSTNTLGQSVSGEGYATEGAGTIAMLFPIELTGLTVGVPARFTFEFEYFAEADGNVKEQHLIDPVPVPAVTRDDADNAYALGTIDLFTDGLWATQFLVYAGDPPGFLPNPPQQVGQNGVTFIITPTQSTYPILLRLTSRVRTYLEGEHWPPDVPGAVDYASASLSMNVFFTSFGPPATPLKDMAQVPGGGVGPSYDFWMSKYEITNLEFVDFLNDAEEDAAAPGGGTEKSAFMFFDPNTGNVSTPGGVPMFELLDTAIPGGGFTKKIRYRPFMDPGTRYVVDAHAEVEAVVGVTWVGALKYCNWLTLQAGYPPSERCYNEGNGLGDWHPVTISTADWAVRDLDATERADLVANYRGFRLPMDNLGYAVGYIDNQVNDFNEWYKASAYDPAAPNSTRVGPGGEDVPAFHWFYGFGRDTIGDHDANYSGSSDPWDNGVAFVGYFDGVTIMPDGITTNDTDNPYGIYDLAGNVAEWGQDQQPAAFPSPTMRFTRTGSWNEGRTALAASRRWSEVPTHALQRVGFRVLTTFQDAGPAAPLPAPFPHDRRKNRYISFDPDKANNDGQNIAFKVELLSINMGSCNDGTGAQGGNVDFCRTDRGAADCKACSGSGDSCISASIDCPTGESCDPTGAVCANDLPNSGGSNVGMVWWVGPEKNTASDPDLNIHLLVSQPFRKVSTDWPSPVHAGDCEVVPQAVFGIRAVETTGGAESNELAVSTTALNVCSASGDLCNVVADCPPGESCDPVGSPAPFWWGDVVGVLAFHCNGDIREQTCDPNTSNADCTGPGTPAACCTGVGTGLCDCPGGDPCARAWELPNGVTNVDDVTAALWTSAPAPPTTVSAEFTWVDVHGNDSFTPGSQNFDPPNNKINASDLQQIISGFGGFPNKFHDPADCPDESDWP